MRVVSFDRVTDTVAVGAVASPLWLNQMSEISQLLLPIAGLLWLLIQIVLHIHRDRKDRK